MNIDLDALGALYPDGWNDKRGAAAAFGSADSNYRVYQPDWSANSDGGGTATLTQDNDVSAETDDHCTLTVTFDASGKITKLSADWSLGTGETLPSWAIDLASDAAAVAADAIIDVLSEGLAIELDPVIAEITADLVTAAGDCYNFFANHIASYYDNGGQLNFIAVVNHNLNKLCSALRATSPAIASTGVTFKFSDSNFLKAMDAVVGNAGSWDDKDGAAVAYTQRYNGGDRDYRTWRPDTSVMIGGTGLYISTKIDNVRGDDQDDHIILMLGVNAAGVLIQAQAAVQFGEANPLNQKPAPYVTDVITAADGVDVADALQAAMQALTLASYDESDNSRQNIPNVTRLNLDSLVKAVSCKG